MDKPIKRGRGIEITYEALIEMVRQRFPNLVDWDYLTQAAPMMDLAESNGVLGMYFVRRDDEEYAEGTSTYGARRIGEGAPIPTVRISFARLRRADGKPSCGQTYPEWNHQSPADDQCVNALGHTGEHVYLGGEISDVSLVQVSVVSTTSEAGKMDEFGAWGLDRGRGGEL